MVNLVLSGGAIKGFCYVGLLRFLEENESFKKSITTLVGTSIGAFSCMIIALGYSYKVISEVLMKYDASYISSPRLRCIIENGCLDKGENLEKFVKTFIKKKFNENITLSEFYLKTGKNLALCVTCVDNSNIVFLDHLNFPDMPLYLAVSASMRIPYIFQNLEYLGKFYCDGVLVGNLPIRYITKDNPEKTYCFSFENKSQDTEFILKIPIEMLGKYNREYASSIDADIITITIPEEIKVHLFSFEVDEKDKTALIELGYTYINTFFENKKTP